MNKDALLGRALALLECSSKELSVEGYINLPNRIDELTKEIHRYYAKEDETND